MGLVLSESDRSCLARYHRLGIIVPPGNLGVQIKVTLRFFLIFLPYISGLRTSIISYRTVLVNIMPFLRTALMYSRDYGTEQY